MRVFFDLLGGNEHFKWPLHLTGRHHVFDESGTPGDTAGVPLGHIFPGVDIEHYTAICPGHIHVAAGFQVGRQKKHQALVTVGVWVRIRVPRATAFHPELQRFGFRPVAAGAFDQAIDFGPLRQDLFFIHPQAEKPVIHVVRLDDEVIHRGFRVVPNQVDLRVQHYPRERQEQHLQIMFHMSCAQCAVRLGIPFGRGLDTADQHWAQVIVIAGTAGRGSGFTGHGQASKRGGVADRNRSRFISHGPAHQSVLPGVTIRLAMCCAPEYFRAHTRNRVQGWCRRTSRDLHRESGVLWARLQAPAPR